LSARPLLRLAALALLSALAAAPPAGAQQAVRVKSDGIDIPAQLWRPATAKAPAVALFHGCGGVGQNNTRMAGLLQGWGYVALVVDSFSSRGLKDVCGRHWPTQADAETRALDIDASLRWLDTQPYVRAAEVGFMGYSYGGGVAALRAFAPRVPARAAILVYPDCALAEPLGPRLTVPQPTLVAMGALDDWTPVTQCQALFDRIATGRDLLETHVYPGAHHSVDALGLPVRYLDGVGNRSKPGGCCGAHYGANEAAWKAFVGDVRGFLAKSLPR
jgi:dienelactone hydrolase